MAVCGNVVNAPSGSQERAVANAIVLMGDKPLPKSSAPDGALTSAFSGPINIGAVRSFALPPGINKRSVEMPIWAVSCGVGFVSQTGKFVALRGGTGKVMATLADGSRFTQSVTVNTPVLPTPAAPAEVPKSDVSE